MGTSTPKPIRIEVIRKWLEGKGRDQIATEVGIGAGSVSSILKECRQNDPEFDLMREVAVKLKDQGDSIESFAPLVRIREIVRKTEGAQLDRAEGGGRGGEKAEGNKEYEQQQKVAQQKIEEKMESLIVALEVFCFKQNLSIKDFVNQISHLCSVADRLGVPLEKLRSYVEELENKVNMIEEEIEGVNLKKQDVLEDYGVTLELLQEYRANRPLVETNKKLREQLDSYKIKLAEKILGEQFDKFMDELEWSISEEELEEANIKLGYARSFVSSIIYRRQGLTPDKLKKMLMEVYFNPSKYIDIIKQLMKTTQ